MLVIGRDNADFAAQSAFSFFPVYLCDLGSSTHNCFTNGSKMRVVFYDLLNEIQLQFESIQGVKTGVPTSDIVCLYTYANIAHITALW